MLAQIAFEPGQFPRRPSVRPAVVQHGDMHTAGIEAVVRRPPRILAEQPLRRLTPYIVIAWREIKWNPPVGPDKAHRLPPLGFRRSVVQPLYGSSVSCSTWKRGTPTCFEKPDAYSMRTEPDPVRTSTSAPPPLTFP